MNQSSVAGTSYLALFHGYIFTPNADEWISNSCNIHLLLKMPVPTLRLESIRPFAHFSYKFEIFDWSKMGVKMIEKSPILQKMLIYVGYHPSRNLDPIFSVVLKIRAFEVVSLWFYLIKCPFFGNFDFEGLYFKKHWIFWAQISWGVIPNIFK